MPESDPLESRYQSIVLHIEGPQSPLQQIVDNSGHSVGNVVTILHLLPDRNMASKLWGEAQRVFGDFWREERPVRTEAYEPTMAAFGLREEFARKVADAAGAGQSIMVVDLGGATGHQARPTVLALRTANPEAQIGYIHVDVDPEVKKPAEAQLSGIDGLTHRSVVIADFSNGLPEQVKDEVAEFRPDRLIVPSFYALTYQPWLNLKALLDGTRDFARERGIPASSYILALNPDFDPAVLGQMFGIEIAPKLTQTEEGRRILSEAQKALPRSVPHGQRVLGIMPIWPQGAIEALLEGAGYSPVSEQVLWGHSNLFHVGLYP